MARLVRELNRHVCVCAPGAGKVVFPLGHRVRSGRFSGETVGFFHKQLLVQAVRTAPSFGETSLPLWRTQTWVNSSRAER